MIATLLSTRRSLALLFALLFAAAILVLSIVPINRIKAGTRPGFGATAAAIHHAAVAHIAVHVIIFAVAAGVAWWTAILAASENPLIGKLLAVVTTLLLGCATEYLEHAVGTTPIELNDVFTNLLASSITFVILALLARYRRSHTP